MKKIDRCNEDKKDLKGFANTHLRRVPEENGFMIVVSCEVFDQSIDHRWAQLFLLGMKREKVGRRDLKGVGLQDPGGIQGFGSEEREMTVRIYLWCMKL